MRNRGKENNAKAITNTPTRPPIIINIATQLIRAARRTHEAQQGINLIAFEHLHIRGFRLRGC